MSDDAGTMPSRRKARLRLGVVGCGAVTERYHLPALLNSPDVEIVAFVDSAIKQAQRLAARAGTALVLANHRDLIGKVDIALLAVPNAFHEPIAVDLLQAGVHVLVEKPMARSVAECERMLAAAHTAGVMLAVGHDFRHYPVARFAHDLFAADLLGVIRRVDIEQSTGTRWPAVSTAALSREAGGGVLIDFGVHILDLLLWWLGDMQAQAYQDNALGGVESECICTLMLGNGAPVRFELSRVRRMRDTIIVEGERGTIEIGVFDPAVIRLTLPGGHPALVGGIPDLAFERAPLQEVFARQLGDVVAAIHGGHKPLVDGHDGKRAVALVEACYSIKQPLRLPWDYPQVYASIGRKGP